MIERHLLTGSSLRRVSGRLGICSVLACLLTACSGSITDKAPNPQPETPVAAGIADLLPALPPPTAGPQPRSTSADSVTRNGSAFFAVSPDVQIVDTTAVLAPAAEGISFAMYQFQVDLEEQLDKLTVNLSNFEQGESAWLGISNYDLGRWQFYTLDEAVEEIDVPDDPGVFSNGQSFYVTLVAFDGAGFSFDSMTLSYISAPFPGWQHSWGSGESDHPIDIKIDPAGNLYLIGSYAGDDGAGGEGADPLAIVKYSPEGSLLAAKTLFLDAEDSGFGQPGLTANEMLVDANGNLFISANFSYSPDDDGLANNDFAMCRLDSNLNLLWINRLRRNESEGFSGMAFDEDGNVVLAGSYSLEPGGGSGGFTASYARVSPQGLIIEAKSLGIGGRLNGVSVDQVSGDIFFSGTLDEGFAGSPLMIRLSEGAVAWSRSWSNVDGQSGQGIAPGPEGAATLLVKESPNTRYASPEQEPVFLSVDKDGELVSVKVFASPAARSVVQYMEVEGATARICAPWSNTGSGLNGVMIYEFPLGELDSIDGTLWVSDISVADDFATNGTNYAFFDNSFPSNEQARVFPQPMQVGALMDVTGDTALASVSTNPVDFGGEFTAESNHELLDTAGQLDGAPDDDSMRITYYSGT